MCRGSWLAALVFVLPACKREGERAQELKAGGVLAESLNVTASAEPPKTMIEWSAPSCPLHYAFVADLEMYSLDEPGMPRPFGGIRMSGTFTATGDEEGRTVIENGDVEISHVDGGVKRPGGVQPAGSLAEVRLRLDGGQWLEVDGPTALWSAYGSFPGLVEFFPALPSDTTIGASAPWALTIHRRGDGMGVESTRGKTPMPEGMPVPEPKPNTLDATAAVGGWLSVEGEQAVVLTSRLEHSEDVNGDPGTPLADMKSRVKLQRAGEFVVLSSGRLLLADVRGTTDAETTFDADNVIKQRHDLHATLRLLGACDGPVLKAADDVAKPEEAALQMLAELHRAVVEDDADEVAEHLAPEILEAHGRDTTLRLLREHVERHGPTVLGIAAMARSTKADGDRVHVVLGGSSNVGHWSVTTVIEVESREGRPVIVSMGTDTVEKDAGWRVLEVSAARLHSGDPE